MQLADLLALRYLSLGLFPFFLCSWVSVGTLDPHFTPVQHKTIESSITHAQVISCSEGSYLLCHRDHTLQHCTPFLDSYGTGCIPITVPQHLSGFGIILSKHPPPCFRPASSSTYSLVHQDSHLAQVLLFLPTQQMPNSLLKGTDLTFPSHQHILWQRPPS